MILGIGHDLCDIRRIERLLETLPQRFKSRIYTEKERAAAQGRQNEAAYLALRFAAKEAIYKAFSRYDQTGMSWHHAEILNDSKTGAPTVSLYGPCLEALCHAAPDGYDADIQLSLSDEYPYASAYVILSARPLLSSGRA